MTKLDQNKLIEGALAILSLTRHQGTRVWKTLDWELLNQMHDKGWITNPQVKSKSVVLTNEGAELAEKFLEKYFSSESGKKPGKQKKVKSQNDFVQSPGTAHVIRCTKKLLNELRVEPVETISADINPIREWHANIITIERRKCILVTHSLSLYSFVVMGVKRNDLDHFDKVFFKNLSQNLAEDQIDSPILYNSQPQEIEVVYTKTNDRKVLGSMNDFTRLTDIIIWNEGGVNAINPLYLSRLLNDTPMSAIKLKKPIKQLSYLLSNPGDISGK